MKYNYFDAVKRGIQDALWENFSQEEIIGDKEERKAYFRGYVFNKVTGIYEGSYYENSYDAEMALFSNDELVKEAMDWVGIQESSSHPPKELDSIVRSYVFDKIYDDVFDVEFKEAKLLY